MKITDDHDFHYLKNKLNNPNIFIFLKNLSFEIRHSTFLAWLFDTEASHGKGTLFLELFLDSIGEEKPNDAEKFVIKREQLNIDILIFSKTRVIVIENKLEAKDSEGQLRNYRDKIEQKFLGHKIIFIYWTLEGLYPIDAKEAGLWRLYSYDKFVNALEPILAQLDGTKNALYLLDYIEALKIQFLKNSAYSLIGKNLVIKYKSDISKVFLNSKSYELPERVTLEFLERHSSFTRGNGFFSKENIYFNAFKDACISNGYELTFQGKNQSTYFGFVPTSLLTLISADERCFYFSFRYYEKNSILRFGFGISPEEPSNKKIRDHLLGNIGKFHSLECCVPVKARGKQHIGLLRKDIPFDTMQFSENMINSQIAKIFFEEIKSVVKEIVDVTSLILIGAK